MLIERPGMAWCNVQLYYVKPTPEEIQARLVVDTTNCISLVQQHSDGQKIKRTCKSHATMTQEYSRQSAQPAKMKPWPSTATSKRDRSLSNLVTCDNPWITTGSDIELRNGSDYITVRRIHTIGCVLS